jgi:hypothetical protein
VRVVVEACERYISEGSVAEKAAIDSHIQAIESVHHVPASLPEVCVYVDDPTPGHLGDGVPGKHLVKIHSPEGMVASEEIILNRAWVFDVNSTVHEIGHSLDLHALGGTPAPAEILVDRWFSSHSEAERWYAAVSDSEAFKQLAAQEGGVAPEAMAYWLDLRELWARSYEQWIAQRSGHTELGAKIARRRKELPGLYWQERDFTTIAAAIEELFATRGLVK